MNSNTMGKLLRPARWLGLGLTVLLGGCFNASFPSKQAPMVIDNPVETYVLEVDNTIRVTVFGQENLSGDYKIDPGGRVSLPLIDSVPAAGKTAAGVAQAISDTLKNGGYLHDPKTTVEVLNFRPFYVLGEVRQPGEFTYSLGMTVLSAVARAGGYDYRAREGEAVLVRIVNGQQIEYHAQERTPILPGDIIKVLER